MIEDEPKARESSCVQSQSA